jgi:hypothetical protein
VCLTFNLVNTHRGQSSQTPAVKARREARPRALRASRQPGRPSRQSSRGSPHASVYRGFLRQSAGARPCSVCTRNAARCASRPRALSVRALPMARALSRTTARLPGTGCRAHEILSGRSPNRRIWPYVVQISALADMSVQSGSRSVANAVFSQASPALNCRPPQWGHWTGLAEMENSPGPDRASRSDARSRLPMGGIVASPFGSLRHDV